MTTEQAIKLMHVEMTCIERASNIDHPCTRECEKCDLLQTNEDLIAAYGMAVSALRAQQWISVKDRLPKDGKNVLVLIPYRGVILNYVSYRESDEWYVPDRLGRFSLSDVTHWIPLPEPPKEAHDE